MSHELLKISFNLHITHRCMCYALIVGRVLTAGHDSHTQRPWPCLVSGAGNTKLYISPNQTDLTSTQWTTVSVASTNSMSTSPVCSKCQWTEAASVRRLVYSMEQSDSTIDEWRTSLQAYLRLNKNTFSNVVTLITGWTNDLLPVCNFNMLRFIVISTQFVPFSNFCIFQGSAATCLRCDGIFL